MKTLKLLIVVTLLLSAFAIGSCKKHHAQPSPVAQLDKLKFAWKATSVTLDDVVKDTYGDFKLTMTGSAGAKTFSFTTEGRPELSPWPGSGTFTFNDTSPTTILLRNDQVSITYLVTETTLTMKFFYSTPGYVNRTGSVKGAWEFGFTK